MEYKPQRKEKDSVVEPCRLCGLVKELQFSHIVPEWFYTRLYDDKGRIHVLSTDESSRHKQIQKGLREYLLHDGIKPGEDFLFPHGIGEGIGDHPHVRFDSVSWAQ
ncbi:MAG: hypothetical protein WCH43_10875 [Verrucomicrobiota bacterium]